jgi:hexosaminidase
MPRILIAVAVCLISFTSRSLSQTSADLPLMPQPWHATPGRGALPVDSSFKIVLEAPAGDEVASSAAVRLQHSLEHVSGRSIPIATGSKARSGKLIVVVNKAATARIGADESYSLKITSKGAQLEAPTSIGAVRGMATLRQLTAGQGPQTILRAVRIEDAPLYPWRGLMIDTARHFIPMDALERTLDAMELVKLNVLHLHLSDNEGFRVESKVFPKLQEEGSNGEFYTQAELKKFINDAFLRGIVVVPEFDMPSHAQSWLAAYPDLSSSPGPFKAGKINYGDIPKNPTPDQVLNWMDTTKFPAVDPSRESTYNFIDRLIGEMTELFPAPYFHIGADENNGAVWMANPSIVAFMNEHHIADGDTPALQAYFVARVSALVKKHDRTMVAWEEAYAPGSKIGGIYQVWKPRDQVWKPRATIDLMKTQLPSNDRLLLSRGFYLNDFLPAYVHYLNKELPDSVPADSPLLGGEAAIWTELADRTNLEARVWPRAGAIAERLWTPPGTSADPESFYQRLFQLSALLDRAGVHNLVDYREGVARIAGSDPVQPVENLLDVLTPLKGYKRFIAEVLLAGSSDTGLGPLDQVADVVLVDSEAKYRFRAAVAAFLAQPDKASALIVRTWLKLWSANDELLKPTIARSAKLAAVAGHSQRLAALAVFTLGVMDRLQHSLPLTAKEMAHADELLTASQAAEGQAELCVVPEFTALLHGTLAPEPTSYPPY